MFCHLHFTVLLIFLPCCLCSAHCSPHLAVFPLPLCFFDIDRTIMGMVIITGHILCLAIVKFIFI
jgi:hypothetical protein